MTASENGPSEPGGIRGKVELMHIIERLKTQTRTGWVNVRVPGRVESIADHMYRMAMLSLLSEEDEELDIAKCVQMAVVHDLAEALVGDITPHDGISKAQKQKLEEDAMNTLTKVHLNPQGRASKRIRSLFEEYEQRSSREARFVKDLDLLEMALQGYEYETDRKAENIQPFFESSIPKIQHPEVRQWADEIMNQRQSNHVGSSTYKHVSTQVSDTENDAPSAAIVTPDPLVQLPPSSVRVTDADDEIFELYTLLSTTQQENPPTAEKSPTRDHHHGLGFLDSRNTFLDLSIDIPLPFVRSAPSQHSRYKARRKPLLPPPAPKDATTSSRPTHKAQVLQWNYATVEAKIQQDLTRLHGRDGDTGSVVWDASILLAKLLLTDASLGRSEFINPSLLSNAKILELGSGTGTLSILLGQLVKEWTATDIAELLPLIAKNHKHNITRLAHTNLNLRELDWTWSSQMFARNAQETVHQQYDLLFAADCLYNEALIQPFVNTINRVNSKYVVIVSELRSAEVLRLFVQLWLASGTWHIYRVGGYNHSDERPVKKEREGHPDGPLGHKHVMWVGWKAA